MSALLAHAHAMRSLGRSFDDQAARARSSGHPEAAPFLSHMAAAFHQSASALEAQARSDAGRASGDPKPEGSGQ
jgi:hypothetical protein